MVDITTGMELLERGAERRRSSLGQLDMEFALVEARQISYSMLSQHGRYLSEEIVGNLVSFITRQPEEQQQQAVEEEPVGFVAPAGRRYSIVQVCNRKINSTRWGGSLNAAGCAAGAVYVLVDVILSERNGLWVALAVPPVFLFVASFIFYYLPSIKERWDKRSWCKRATRTD